MDKWEAGVQSSLVSGLAMLGVIWHSFGLRCASEACKPRTKQRYADQPLPLSLRNFTEVAVRLSLTLVTCFGLRYI